ncbi:MAG TPA: hypothetical protein VGN39_13825 [Terriglobales bacterium]|nr:hypothetical protein [Terriglobales bacterium]
MKHFSEAQWADFARRVVSPRTEVDMQQHIQNGCQKCSDTLQLWQTVLAIAVGEGAFTPPGDVVRVVKSQFAAALPALRRGLRLLFDSSLQPITAGIRGSVSARQFLYETEDYYIDLRLEPRRNADRACLVGQILTRGGTQLSDKGFAVRVQKGKQPIAETTANQFGEFQLEFDGASDLCVSISRKESDDSNPILLPLYGVHVKSSETSDLD